MNDLIAFAKCYPSSFPRIFRNIGEFGAEKSFTDHQQANTARLSVAINILLDKCDHLFIYISLN